MSFLNKCNCAKYYIAFPCSGTPGMTVYYHEDYLPTETVVVKLPDITVIDGENQAYFCFQFVADPVGDPVCLPNDLSTVLVYDPPSVASVDADGNIYGCVECEADESVESDPVFFPFIGTPGGSAGGGSLYTPSPCVNVREPVSSDIFDENDNITTEFGWFQASPCANQSSYNGVRTNVFVLSRIENPIPYPYEDENGDIDTSRSDDPPPIFTFSIGNICYQVDLSNSIVSDSTVQSAYNSIDGASLRSLDRWYDVDGEHPNFDFCIDCTHGIKATLCEPTTHDKYRKAQLCGTFINVVDCNDQAISGLWMHSSQQDSKIYSVKFNNRDTVFKATGTVGDPEINHSLLNLEGASFYDTCELYESRSVTEHVYASILTKFTRSISEFKDAVWVHPSSMPISDSEPVFGINNYPFIVQQSYTEQVPIVSENIVIIQADSGTQFADCESFINRDVSIEYSNAVNDVRYTHPEDIYFRKQSVEFYNRFLSNAGFSESVISDYNFRQNGNCYSIDLTSESFVLIPDNPDVPEIGESYVPFIDILCQLPGIDFDNLDSQLETCSDCRGIKLYLCPGQNNTEKATGSYWVRTENIPPSSGIIRIGAWCYQLDITRQITDIPPNARTIIPYVGCFYPTCEECLCSEVRFCGLGYQAELCSGEDSVNSESFWITLENAENIPNESSFSIDGVCYTVNTSGNAVPIPSTGLIYEVSSTFVDCADCIVQKNDGEEPSPDPPLPPVPPGGGENCFIAGTKVDGKNIEEYEVGDIVTSFCDDMKTHKDVVYKIHKSKSDHIINIITTSNSISCTKNEPIKSSNNFVLASELKKGDYITCFDGSSFYEDKIVDISKNFVDIDVYNLSVEKNETFIANNICVHNKSLPDKTWYELRKCYNNEITGQWTDVFSTGVDPQADGQCIRISGATFTGTTPPGQIAGFNPVEGVTCDDDRCRQVCVERWNCIWDCDTESWGTPTLLTSNCEAFEEAEDSDWTYISCEDGVKYQKDIVTANECGSNDDCVGGSPPDPPSFDPPEEEVNNCCDIPKCTITWRCVWDCETESWGNVESVTGPDCEVDCTSDSWSYHGCSGSGVEYRAKYCYQSCVTVGDCDQIPVPSPPSSSPSESEQNGCCIANEEPCGCSNPNTSCRKIFQDEFIRDENGGIDEEKIQVLARNIYQYPLSLNSQEMWDLGFRGKYTQLDWSATWSYSESQSEYQGQYTVREDIDIPLVPNISTTRISLRGINTDDDLDKGTTKTKSESGLSSRPEPPNTISDPDSTNDTSFTNVNYGIDPVTGIATRQQTFPSTYFTPGWGSNGGPPEFTINGSTARVEWDSGWVVGNPNAENPSETRNVGYWEFDWSELDNFLTSFDFPSSPDENNDNNCNTTPTDPDCCMAVDAGVYIPLACTVDPVELQGEVDNGKNINTELIASGEILITSGNKTYAFDASEANSNVARTFGSAESRLAGAAFREYPEYSYSGELDLRISQQDLCICDDWRNVTVDIRNVSFVFSDRGSEYINLDDLSSYSGMTMGDPHVHTGSIGFSNKSSYSYAGDCHPCASISGVNCPGCSSCQHEDDQCEGVPA